MIPRLHVPLTEPEDVVRHLAEKERHWEEGRSAHALAYAWHRQRGFPPAISSIFNGHPIFRSAKLIDAFLERQTDLGSPGAHSQTDLLAIASIDSGLVIVGVEGKAGETFDRVVHQWLEEGGRRKERLEGLCKTLCLSVEAVDQLRYQLLHRAASAIYEAKRYRTNFAAMIIHSFKDDQRGFSDFCAFARALGENAPKVGTLMGPFPRDGLSPEGVSLYIGWVQDEAQKGTSSWSYLDDLRDYAKSLSQWYERVRIWCDERAAKLKSAE